LRGDTLRPGFRAKLRRGALGPGVVRTALGTNGLAGDLAPVVARLAVASFGRDGGQGEHGRQCGESPSGDKLEFHVRHLLICRGVGRLIEEELGDSPCPISELLV
jgi:hypothetical protein